MGRQLGKSAYWCSLQRSRLLFSTLRIKMTQQIDMDTLNMWIHSCEEVSMCRRAILTRHHCGHAPFPSTHPAPCPSLSTNPSASLLPKPNNRVPGEGRRWNFWCQDAGNSTSSAQNAQLWSLSSVTHPKLLFVTFTFCHTPPHSAHF